VDCNRGDWSHNEQWDCYSGDGAASCDPPSEASRPRVAALHLRFCSTIHIVPVEREGIVWCKTIQGGGQIGCHLVISSVSVRANVACAALSMAETVPLSISRASAICA
jgi:hypothetical protein